MSKVWRCRSARQPPVAIGRRERLRRYHAAAESLLSFIRFHGYLREADEHFPNADTMPNLWNSQSNFINPATGLEASIDSFEVSCKSRCNQERERETEVP